MTKLTENTKAPNFTSKDDQGNTVTLSDFAGKPLVLYFYPKDDTPGCTTESCAFQDNLSQFNKANVQVVGVSKDSVKSHQKFKEKYNLNFPLLSDEDKTLCEAFDVLKEKSMFGKKYMGIVRSTFLIDAEGNIVKIWPKVKVAGHVEEVFKAVEQMEQQSAA